MGQRVSRSANEAVQIVPNLLLGDKTFEEMFSFQKQRKERIIN